jgi:hypothetical protein
MSFSRWIGPAAFAAAVLVSHAAAAQDPPKDPAAQKDKADDSQQCDIAVLMPTIEGVTQDASALATSVRALFVSYLSGPSLKAQPIDARLTSQIAEELKQKSCKTVLRASFTDKHSSGGHSKFGAITGAAGNALGYVPAAGAAEVAVGAASAGAEVVSSMAGDTKAKDEMTIQYRVTTADGAAVFGPKTDSQKAKADGEDLVTPLVTRAAEAVANVIVKK